MEASMNIGLAFWIIMLVWFVFFLAWHFGALGTYGPLGSTILLFILFLLLGWKVFGPPLHG
jgi:hypothetical protein